MRAKSPKNQARPESSRRFRRWLRFGIALPAGYEAKLSGRLANPQWRDVRRAVAPGFWNRLQRPARMEIEPASSWAPAWPVTIQEGNPAGFPLGAPQESPPAFVHWLPSVIYHGHDGAITNPDGSVYAELLDGRVEKLDFGKVKDRALYFEGRVMAFAPAKNHFHWLLKYLPRLGLLERAEGSLDSIETFLINKPTWQQQQVYERLKIWDRCVVIDGRKFAVCRLLTAPSMRHHPPAWACRLARAALPPPGPAGPGRRIYACRGNAATRTVVNEREVCALLEARGFEIVDCAGLSIEEQALAFAGSDTVVSVHGAALSNIVFCSPGTKVLEIFGSPENQKVFWMISHHLRLRYHCLMARPADPGATGHQANIAVDLGLLARSIDLLLE
jgi:hypothetical protein